MTDDRRALPLCAERITLAMPYRLIMYRMLSALIIVATGCTHHRRLDTLKEVAGKEVTVETMEHRQLTAYGDLTPAGVVIRDPAGQVIEPKRIGRIVETSRSRGVAEGLGYGLVLGIAGGAVTGYASGRRHCTECFFDSSPEATAMSGALMLGSLGAIVGMVVGGIRGSRDVYSFGAEELRVTAGPPGSIAGATLTF